MLNSLSKTKIKEASMKVRNIVLIISLLLIPANQTHSQAPQLEQTVVNEMDKFVTQAHEQLCAIEKMIRSLHITITKEKRFTPLRRNRIQLFFSQLIEIVESIKNERFRSADLDTCQMLIEFNHKLISLVEKHRKTKFREVHTFDMDQFLSTLTPKRSLSGEEIFRRFERGASILAKIEREGVGLTRKNRIARWFDDKIVSPSQRYSLPSRLAQLVAIPALSYYFWYRMNKPIKNRFYNDGDDDPRAGDGLIGKVANFDDELTGATFLLRHSGGMVINGILTELYNNAAPTLAKKFQIWLNNAKGGAYIKEADRLENKAKKVRFEDVHGQTEIKRYFKFLVDYLEDSETHERQGIRPSRGILCIGDTRTGKTFCIEAFLEEVNQMLIRTGQIHKYSLIKPSVLRIQIEGMESILRNARAKAPCILFIDEIDLLQLQRNGENRTLSEFLTAMGDAVNSEDPKKQIFIIAATNCPETLDKALRQPGRFGKELRFEYPNYTDRLEFITEKVKEFILPEQEKEFCCEKLALYTDNKSYESINLFIKDAMLKAKIGNNGQLTQTYLEHALEENIFHIIPSHAKTIPVNEQQILAAHFAGQAVALALLESNLKLAKVTIKQVMTKLEEKAMGSHLWDANHKEQQRFEYGKLFTYQENDSIDMQTRQEKINLIKLHVAGFVAEELLLGSCGFSCHAEDDHLIALNLAKSLTFKGIDETKLPKHMVKIYYDQAEALKEQCVQEVTTLLSAHKQSLEAVSNELLEQETIDYEQVQELLAQ
jgi:cell division protease FtsH